MSLCASTVRTAGSDNGLVADSPFMLYGVMLAERAIDFTNIFSVSARLEVKHGDSTRTECIAKV